MVNLPLTIDSSPRSLRNTRTTSADCTPAWNPMLAPASFTKTGLDQVPSGDFTDIKPSPRRPPRMKPALMVSGTTTMPRASSSRRSGIPDSGIDWIWRTTRTASSARTSSRAPAIAADAASKPARANARRRRGTGFMGISAKWATSHAGAFGMNRS